MEEFYPMKYDQEKQKLIPNTQSSVSPREDTDQVSGELPNFKLMQTVDKCLTRELKMLSPRHLGPVSKNLISNLNCRTTTADNASLFSSFVKPLTGAGYQLSEASGGASGMNHSSTANDPYRPESRAH